MQQSDKMWYCCVLNLENNQNDYARCLDTILWLESLSEVGKPQIDSVSDDVLGFYLGRTIDENINSVPRLRKIEEVLLSIEKAGEETEQVKYYNSRSAFLRQFNGMRNGLNLCYYLRIQLTLSDDIVNIQYAVLLMQLLSKVHPRIAIHILWPSESLTFEFHEKYSSYLRFINRSYPVIYVRSISPASTLEKLNSNRSEEVISRTFFPLLVINKDMLMKLNTKWMLTYHEFTKEENRKDLFETHFALKECDDSEYAIPLFRMCMRMMCERIDGHKFITIEKKNMLGSYICKLIDTLQGMDLLELGLLAVIGLDVFKEGIYSPNDDKRFQTTLEQLRLIRQFANAIHQLIENVVYHSQNEVGVFTFRLHGRKTMAYLSSNYPGYVTTQMGDDQERDYLEILISDGNLSHNIMSHFLAREENREFTSLDIRLADFFGYQTKTTEESWNKAHQSRPELCHGLRMFANILRTMNGTFKVNSSARLCEHSQTDFYYQFSNEKQKDILANQKYWLPGTQYSILVDRNNLPHKQELLFDKISTQYSTTASDLVPVLECKAITNVLIPVNSGYTLYDNQRKKNSQISYWRQCFDQLFDQYKHEQGTPVYRFDLSASLEERLGKAQIEPFCKGLFSSQFFRASTGVSPAWYVLLCNLSRYGEFGKIVPQTFAIYSNRLQNKLTPVYVFYSKSESSEKGNELQDWLQPYLGVHPTIDLETENKTVIPRLFPLALFTQTCEKQILTPFEWDIYSKAKKRMCSRSDQGYMISDTHMRLGSKVHLDTFYEMSLFFEDPNNAYYTAFLFVQKLIQSNVFCDNTHLILYGYASYCSGILWAMREMIQLYLEQKNLTSAIAVDFITYQNDLKIESKRTKVQMYYSNPAWQKAPRSIGEIQNIALVQIVPIASSLTTFEKMYLELERETGIKNIKRQINLTATWVKDTYEANYEETSVTRGECDRIMHPTSTEEAYWNRVDTYTRTITTKLNTCNQVEYLISVASKWHNPLFCPLCFPQINNLQKLYASVEGQYYPNDKGDCLWQYDHSAIFEVPLIDTDSTSTVPTQQLYTENGEAYSRMSVTENEAINDTRIAKLQNNLLCRHVSRGKNHYQYYIRTRNYFQQEKEAIRDWLINLQEKEQNGGEASCVNVLVIPRHASCVEFGQYVYEYYFKGEAKSVIVNTEKVFRSNFLAEYRSVFEFLKASSLEGKRIRFYYVDVALTSGDSFRRAASLIASCLRNHDMKAENEQYLFTKVFMLINRMSRDTIRDYVLCDEDFYAYANLKISSMRSFGNSCVPCKMQEEAEFLYKNAATKTVSTYWDVKRYERMCIPFDQKEVDDAAEDYKRLACTHRAAHYFHRVRGLDEEQTFTALRDFISEIQLIEGFIEKQKSCGITTNNGAQKVELKHSQLNEPYISSVYTDDISQLVDVSARDASRDWLSAAFKILARPFYSYDFHIRKVVMDMFLILSELILKDDGNTNIEKQLRIYLENKPDGVASKDYLLRNSVWDTDNLEWLSSLAIWIRKICGDNTQGAISNTTLEWWRNNLLKGLVDMRSNYILRKETIAAVQNIVNRYPNEQAAFWDHYLRSIMRLIHSSRDDTKSVWLEEQLMNYHLRQGDEYLERGR